MRAGRIAAGLLLLAAAVLVALLAVDVRRWHDAFGTVRTPAPSLEASPLLPFDPAGHLLGVAGELAYRRALRDFRALGARGGGLDNGRSAIDARGELEARLAELARGSDPARASLAENLLGILAFADSKPQGPAAPAPVDRSIAAFAAAVRLDPGDDDAKFNLELLLRLLVARGERSGANGSTGPAAGRRGAGGGLPGRGY
jgi:hypothetical protein